jgi:disulfide bond formation protein DsbB
MLNFLKRVAHSRWYWGSLLVIGLSMLSVALGYQYILKEPPCVLCIHVRLWVSLLVLFAALGLFINQSQKLNSMLHLFMLMIGVGLAERSYQLLGTERGFIFGDCVFDLGFPGWFSIDQWIPALYGVETSCGYTPVLLFGITMAEALMAMSALFVLVSLVLLVVSFSDRD